MSAPPRARPADFSLRRRLVGVLLALAAFTALVQASIAYRQAHAEADEIFDYQMEQMALAFLGDIGPPVAGLRGPEGMTGEENDFVVQVWTERGTRLYQSRPHRDVPERAVLGYSDLETPHGRWRVYAMQAADRTVQVAQERGARDLLAREMALQILWPALAVSPLSMLAIWWVIARALQPVEAVRRLVAGRDARDLSALPVRGLPDEVAPLVDEINLLFGRVDAMVDTQRAFVSDAAHELRTPLAALRLQARMVAAAADGPARMQAMERLGQGVDRAAHVVEQLLLLARMDADEPGAAPETVDLAQLARDVVIELSPLAEADGTDLGLEEARAAPVRAVRLQMRSMLRNVVENAVKYARGGVVDVRVMPEDGRAVVLVDDDGPGIPENERERVFDRFHRLPGAGSGEGSGLGLSIAQAAVRRAGGDIVLQTSPRGGLRVRVTLPSIEPRTA